jgi:hypothetical protein
MSTATTFPNWGSRLLLAQAAREQPFHAASLPRFVEKFLQWYELAVLRIDTVGIRVDRPIFLIGLPRSGTTMLQDLLCAHPDVAFVNNTMNRFPTTFCAIEHFRRRLKLDFVGERYLADSVMVSASSSSDAIAFWGEWFKLDPFSVEYSPLRTADFTPADVERIHETIRKVIWCNGDRSKRFFNKLLAPLPHLDVVRDLFPDAKFLHIIRDARFTASSMVKLCRKEIERQKRFRLAVGAEAVFVPYPRFPRLAEYVQSYGADAVRTTAHVWNDAITYLDGLRPSLPHFHEVRFEDILADPRGAVGRLLDFCELAPVTEDQHSFWSKIAEVGTVHHTNRYEEFEVVTEICGDNMRKYGYRFEN